MEGDELTGAVRRYRCADCRVTYVQAPSRLLVEDTEPPG
jgi:hypothetical protein